MNPESERSPTPDTQSQETVRQHLVYEARKMIELRNQKYSDPKNLDWDFEDANRWERHAINAVLDLQVAETQLAELRKQVEELTRERDNLREQYATTLGLKYYPATMNLRNERAESAERRVADLESQFGDLLAVIHRDGGHYVGTHGWKKAGEDAEKVVLAERGGEWVSVAERLPEPHTHIDTKGQTE